MKETLIKQGDRAFRATENLIGESRIFEVFDAAKHIEIRPKFKQIRRVLEVDIENPFGEKRGYQNEPFDPDDMREVFLQ